MSDVFDLQMGKTPDRKNLSYFGGDNIWVSISDIKDKYINSSKEHLTDSAVKETNIKEVQEGTVIMSFKLTVGRTAIAATKLYTNEAIMAFNVKDGFTIDSSFLYYYLSAYRWQGTNKAVMGLTLNKATISSQYISIPPLSVQESIVSELDMLSGIISKHKALQEEYDRLEQSIFYDMFGDPVTNEKGWDKKTLDSLYKVSSSKRIMQSEWTTSGIPFLKVADFVSMIQGNTPSPLAFISEEKYDELKKDNLIPRENDILITSRGTLGLCYIVKDSDAFYFQDGMVSWLSNSNGEILSDYLVKIFKYPSFIAKLNETSNKSTVAYVSISQLSKIQVPVPPLSIQQSFADKISAIEQMKAKNKAAQEEAEMLFNERMTYYF